MNKPPQHIIADYNYFKTLNRMRCLHCNQTRANYTHLKFRNGLIYFYLNCAVCGEDSFYFITIKKLKKIMVRWFFDSKVNTESLEMAIWRMFHLGRYFMTCFRSKDDQGTFRMIWLDLNKNLRRWRWWCQWRYK